MYNSNIGLGPRDKLDLKPHLNMTSNAVDPVVFQQLLLTQRLHFSTAYCCPHSLLPYPHGSHHLLPPPTIPTPPPPPPPLAPPLHSRYNMVSDTRFYAEYMDSAGHASVSGAK